MINNVVLMGRLTADPEMRTTTTGKSVSTFSIAVDRGFVRQGEERQTDFITIVTWERQAEFVCKYFNKGSMIAVQGSIQTRRYEDKTGAKRTAFEVVAREVSFCGSKSETGTSGAANTGAYNNYAQPAPASFQTAAAGDFDEVSLEEEELPF